MKNFVEFYFPGFDLTGKKEFEIASQDIESVKDKIPDKAISFRFFSKNSDGNKINFSGFHFIGNQFSKDDFSLKFPQLAALLETDSAYIHAKAVVRSRSGFFYPVNAEDTVLEI